jgi:hypothetical protein
VRNRSGVIRVAGLVLVAGGLVAGASLSSTSVRLAALHERAGLPERSDVLVEDATLLCPGQSRQGADGLRNVAGAVRAAAAVPPVGLVPSVGAVGSSGAEGVVALTASPSGTSLGSASDRGRAFTASLPETATLDAVSVRATGPLAPGLVAAQTWLRVGDDDRGLALTPCTLPGSDLWLVGGGAGPSRTERLVLVNPGANAVSVRVDVLGAKGPASGPDGRSVSIAPRSRAVLSVDALAPNEPTPVVHAVASGGVVAGVLVDSWIDGATGRGTDDATRSASPATDLIVPGVDVEGEAVLRLANPGPAEALVQVRLLAPTGASQPESLRAVRVPARSTTDVPLSGLAKGPSALRILSDRPVTAGAWVERRATTGEDRMGDFGWVPATPALRALGGLVVPRADQQRLDAALALASGGGGGTANVTTITGGTLSTRTVTLAADTSLSIPLGEADVVWVAPTAGQVHGAVTVSGADGQGPLYSVAALQSAPVTALSVPVRQVAN